MWQSNGKCGGESLEPLPLLLGPPVWRCPTATAARPEILTASPLLAGPRQERACSDDAVMRMPPKWRAMFAHADALKKEYDRATAEHAK